MPQFVQIIMQDGEAMRQNKLWIPRKFMRVYGKDISKYVQVKDPNGKKWDLELSKSDDDIWFEKSWEKLADYYSLRHGHLLVFEYEGNSQFSIGIFDNSASEIEYPPLATTNKGVFANLKRGEMDRTVMGERKVEVIQKIIADFTSEYPYFSCLMQPSYVLPKRDKLYIPCQFWKKHVDDTYGHQAKVLLYSNGKCWNMKVTLEEKYYRSRLDGGWGKFSADNNLQPGNVCVFELISKVPVKFNVHIFHSNENPGDCSFPSKENPADCSSSGKQKQIRPRKDAERKTNTTRPMQSNGSFRITMTPPFVFNGYMQIPAEFVRKHDMKERVKKITLLVGDRSWKVTHQKPNMMYLWLFIRDNGLKAGDTCIFQLIGDSLFKVQIEYDQAGHAPSSVKVHIQ